MGGEREKGGQTYLILLETRVSVTALKALEYEVFGMSRTRGRFLRCPEGDTRPSSARASTEVEKREGGAAGCGQKSVCGTSTVLGLRTGELKWSRI